LSKHIETKSWAYEKTFFPSAEKFFPFSNPNPFPFEPKETKIRENNFSEMKEREERIYNVKFNMNAQTWLLSHYWLFLLEYFFSSQGGPWSKRLCRPYAYGDGGERGPPNPTEDFENLNCLF